MITNNIQMSETLDTDVANYIAELEVVTNRKFMEVEGKPAEKRPPDETIPDSKKELRLVTHLNQNTNLRGLEVRPKSTAAPMEAENVQQKRTGEEGQEEGDVKRIKFRARSIERHE
jgi:23S rRNA pseudoU1915 N3-methylase RlmH